MTFLRTYRTNRLFHQFLKPLGRSRKDLDALSFELALHGFIDLIGGDRYTETPKLLQKNNSKELWELVKKF